MLSQKKSYDAVDLMKFIMAIGVVIIHRHIFPDSYAYANTMLSSRLLLVAVPFFFISSSFFFFRDSFSCNKEPKKLFPFLKRLFIIYFLWTVIYLPCIFVKNHTGHYDEITLMGIIGETVLLVKNFFFSYSFLHFWYLTTLMLSVVVIYFLRKKLSAETIFIISLTVTALWHTVYFLSSKNVSFFQNITSAVPLVVQHSAGYTKHASGHGFLSVALGLLAAKYSDLFPKKLSFAFSVVCIAALMIFGSKYVDSTNPLINFAIYVFSVFSSFFIFMFCLKVNLKPSPIYRKLRDYSILIYFSHLLIITETYNYMAAVTGIDSLKESNTLQFVITLIFSLTVSWIIISLEKRGLKQLKYLH